MSVEAAIAYVEHAGVPDAADTSEVARQAAEAGFEFEPADLGAVLSVRWLLARLRSDAALAARVQGAASPQRQACEVARELGRPLDEPALLAVLAVLHVRLQREDGALDDAALESVAGGAYFVPELGDEVLVGFVSGDVRAPVILGGLWNGTDKPPQ